MNQTQLKRASRDSDISARIISDGCRDYLVEIEHGRHASLLCNSGKGAIRFKSLAEVNGLLDRYNVARRRLVVRIADDEVGQPGPAHATFNDVPIAAQAN